MKLTFRETSTADSYVKMTELAETGGKEEECMYLVFFFVSLFFKCEKLQQKQLSCFCILFCFKYDQCG